MDRNHNYKNRDYTGNYNHGDRYHKSYTNLRSSDRMTRLCFILWGVAPWIATITRYTELSKYSISTIFIGGLIFTLGAIYFGLETFKFSKKIMRETGSNMYIMEVRKRSRRIVFFSLMGLVAEIFIIYMDIMKV